jgi:hypothetical protein
MNLSRVFSIGTRHPRRLPHMAKTVPILMACLLGVLTAGERKVTVETTPGPPMVVVKRNQPRTVIRGVNFVITNHYAQPLTAFVVWGDEPKGTPPAEDPVTTNVYFDSVIHESERPVMPGRTRTEKSLDPKARFRGAVFADGSTFGDPAWSDRILHHRELYLRMIDRAIRCVETFPNAVHLPLRERLELFEKIGPCPGWDLKARGLTLEEQYMFYPLSQEVSRALAFDHLEPEPHGPSIGSPQFGWIPVARFTQESQKLRALRARVVASIPPGNSQEVR